MLTQQQSQLRVARPAADDPHWDDFVRSAPDSQIGHLSGWRRIIEDVLGREYIPLVAITTEGEWRGVLPLVRIRAPLLGHSIVSLPYLNYGGSIGTSEAQRRLCDAAVMEAQRSGADLLQIRRRTELPGTPSIVRKDIVLLDLPDTPDELWGAFPAKLRTQIRRPLKEGMELRIGPDQLAPFYAVFARNMRDLGTPVYSRRFFEAIADTFEEAVFGAVYWRGQPVGGGCGFVWRGEFEMTWASCIRDYNPMAPNMLLYWGFMEAMIGRGVRVFNFGRSTPDSSTHRFKLQWGGRAVPLPWLEWSAEPRPVSAGATPLMQFAAAAWRRLPLSVANLVGPALASRLPWW